MKAMLDRDLVPTVTAIDNIIFPSVNESHINNIELYTFDLGANTYTMLQFVFPAGKMFTHKKLVADLVADMILSGTSTKNSYEIAELLDFYGASIESYCSEDDTSVRVYCLTKHLKEVLELVKEIFNDSIFPEEEAKIILNKWKQKQQINFQKTEYMAARLFKNVIFGDEHSYGKMIQQQDFDEVIMEDIRTFYKQNYQEAKYQVVSTGCAPEIINELLNHFTSTSQKSRKLIEIPYQSAKPNEQKVHHLEMQDSVQCSLVIGREMFNMHHQDYMDMYVLNSLLGGYFGSRLMSNLREDKGFTYGIHSTLYARRLTGVFEISTEVNKEHLKEAINEIKMELQRLISEPVNEEELQIVKNYILGHTLRGIDGPIKTAKLYKTLLVQDLNFNFSKDFENCVRKVSPQRLQELAAKYFQQEDLLQIVVG